MFSTIIEIERSIPSLQYWINPLYEGTITRFDKDVLKKEVNLPEDWKKDFPDFNYQYEHLLKLLEDSNPTDTPIHKLINNETAEHFNAVWLDYYRLFQIILEKFGSKKEPTNNKTVKRKLNLTKYMCITEDKILNSIHINCEPAVLASLNHYVRTKFKYPWEWLITFDIKRFKEYKINKKVSPKVNDPFDEIPKQCGLFLGVEGDGDFTNINNIRSLDFTANLFTSCAKTNNNSDILANIICMCYTLQKEGFAIIQLDITKQNCSFMIGIIYLLSCMFQTASIVNLRKLYFVGFNFKGLVKTYLIRLTKLLPYYRHLKGLTPALFVRNSVPSKILSLIATVLIKKYDTNDEKKLEILKLNKECKIFNQ